MAKVLVIQEDEERLLPCQERPLGPLFPGSGCRAIRIGGGGAACPPLSQAALTAAHPVSSLRLKSRRKQAAMRPEGVEDEEDPVMGTVAWVSDAGTSSPAMGAPGRVHLADSG